MKATVEVTYTTTAKITIYAPENFVKILNGTLNTDGLSEDEKDTLYDNAYEYIKELIARDHSELEILDIDVK